METLQQTTIIPSQPISPANNTLSQALEQHRKSQTQDQRLKKPAPHVLIIGKSGTGKSRAIKTLPPKETCVINIENKILPFSTAKEFDANSASGFSHAIQVDKLLTSIKDEPSIKYIIIDSITKYFEMLMIESKSQGGGFEIFNRYNANIYNLLEACKKITDKIIIFIGIDELIKDEQTSGAMTNKRSLWVEGRVHAGKVEKEFSVVLYTDVKISREGQETKIDYRFVTNTDGYTSAKSPEGLFPYYIPNDLGFVVKKVEEYFGLAK